MARSTGAGARRGQASVEWVGVLAVAAALVVGLVGVAPRWAGDLAATVDRVVCALAGGACSADAPAARPAADRPPAIAATGAGARPGRPADGELTAQTFDARRSSAPGTGLNFGDDAACAAVSGDGDRTICRGADGHLREDCGPDGPCDADFVPIRAIEGVACATAPNELANPTRGQAPAQLCGYRTADGVGVIARCVPAPPGRDGTDADCTDTGEDPYASIADGSIVRCEGVRYVPAATRPFTRFTTYDLTGICVSAGRGVYACHTRATTHDAADGTSTPPIHHTDRDFTCDNRSLAPESVECRPSGRPNLDDCVLVADRGTRVRCANLGGTHHHCALATTPPRPEPAPRPEPRPAVPVGADCPVAPGGARRALQASDVFSALARPAVAGAIGDPRTLARVVAGCGGIVFGVANQVVGVAARNGVAYVVGAGQAGVFDFATRTFTTVAASAVPIGLMTLFATTNLANQSWRLAVARIAPWLGPLAAGLVPPTISVGGQIGSAVPTGAGAGLVEVPLENPGASMEAAVTSAISYRLLLPSSPGAGANAPNARQQADRWWDYATALGLSFAHQLGYSTSTTPGGRQVAASRPGRMVGALVDTLVHFGVGQAYAVATSVLNRYLASPIDLGETPSETILRFRSLLGDALARTGLDPQAVGAYFHQQARA